MNRIIAEFVITRSIEPDGFYRCSVGEELIRCQNCKHYQGECCVRFGRQEHPHRDPEDYCSKGEKK